MENRCVLAVSGTPGTGKTTACEALTALGWEVLLLADLASEHGCLEEVDSNDGAAPIDIHRLAEAWEAPKNGRYLVDGHLAHFLEVDGVVLLRCRPSTLQERLLQRQYSEAKIRANVEWEMTSGHWAELLEFEIAVPVAEFDTASMATDALVKAIDAWANNGLPSADLNQQASEAIDWLGESLN
jgi:adenylate kinase